MKNTGVHISATAIGERYSSEHKKDHELSIDLRNYKGTPQVQLTHMFQHDNSPHGGVTDKLTWYFPQGETLNHELSCRLAMAVKQAIDDTMDEVTFMITDKLTDYDIPLPIELYENPNPLNHYTKTQMETTMSEQNNTVVVTEPTTPFDVVLTTIHPDPTAQDARDDVYSHLQTHLESEHVARTRIYAVSENRDGSFTETHCKIEYMGDKPEMENKTTSYKLDIEATQALSERLFQTALVDGSFLLGLDAE